MGQFVGPHALFLKLFISVSLSFSRLFCFSHFSSLAGRKKKLTPFLERFAYRRRCYSDANPDSHLIQPIRIPFNPGKILFI
ncbi:unnamed protein product [Rhodiola kirilowii]